MLAYTQIVPDVDIYVQMLAMREATTFSRIEGIQTEMDETWNSITSSRQVITSGLYIAHFETPEGENAIQKFIIVR
ncbi:MAG: Fic/DOC family N-terminal domain-containing protein [Candidatus Marinimicrobia bacterium]|jgi:hypothetical protein|nr:Fic/DOC family N-terminal domain-containing protein [Candidatus Neomarinimicrobiota bacterium]|tara:strand:- start:10217 stop:10444 length:228 start_codon:yes stop_codon:yes gene_type:complete